MEKKPFSFGSLNLTPEQAEFLRKALEAYEQKNQIQILVNKNSMKDITPYSRPCLLENYYKDHPERMGAPVFISCPCPRCSLWCLED